MITQLVKLPEILHIQLNRFDFFGFAGVQKLNNFIKCPRQLDLKKYLIHEHQNPSTIYQLYGILVHSGTALSGHYVSELNLGINKNVQEWYLFNDGSVFKISIPSTEKTPSNSEYGETPYLLIYIRQDCIQSLFRENN
jgi:ubiquitin C-terminal hydrolase